MPSTEERALSLACACVFRRRKGVVTPACACVFRRRTGVVTRLCVCLPQKKGRRHPRLCVFLPQKKGRCPPACACVFRRRKGVVPPPVRVSSEGVKASGRYLTSRTEGNCEFSNVTSAATRRKPSLGRHCTGGATSLTLGRHCTGGDNITNPRKALHKKEKQHAASPEYTMQTLLTQP